MKKVAIAMAVVMMFVLAAAFTAMATQKAPAVKKFTGEVVKMDTKAGTITVKVGTKEKTLKANAKMLEGIEVGDKVEIEHAGKMVKSIKKVEAPTPAATPSTPPSEE